MSAPSTETLFQPCMCLHIHVCPCTCRSVNTYVKRHVRDGGRVYKFGTFPVLAGSQENAFSSALSFHPCCCAAMGTADKRWIGAWLPQCTLIYKPRIPTLGRWKEEDCKFKITLSYVAN